MLGGQVWFLVPSWRFKQSDCLTSEDGLLHCPKTLITSYHSLLCNIPGDERHHHKNRLLRILWYDTQCCSLLLQIQNITSRLCVVCAAEWGPISGPRVRGLQEGMLWFTSCAAGRKHVFVHFKKKCLVSFLCKRSMHCVGVHRVCKEVAIISQ
jgi:hypothetical protein